MYPLLKASDGAAVVNIGSRAGGSRAIAESECIQQHKSFLLMMLIAVCHYNMSKSALNMLTKTLACEWAPDKIRVNCVAPGVIDTDMTKSVNPFRPFVQFLADVCICLQMIEDPEALKLYNTETPMRRPGQPREIASNAIL